MNVPRVSVVIPTYNRSAMLCEAVESVLVQTCQDFEILIVDDGSTDDTREVIQERYGDNTKIRYFYKENGGPGAARNFGMERAKGEMIAFLDSDDIWLPEKLECQVRALQENSHAAWCFCNATYFGQGVPSITFFETQKFQGIISFIDLFEKNFVPSASTVLARQESIYESGGFASMLCEDWDMWLHLSQHYSIAYIHRPLIRYRCHSGNISTTKWIDMKKGEMQILKKYTSEFLKRGGSEHQLAERLYRLHKKMAKELIRQGRIREARPHLWKWWKAHPLRLKVAWRLLQTYVHA